MQWQQQASKLQVIAQSQGGCRLIDHFSGAAKVVHLVHAANNHGAAHLEHLDEGDGEVEVDSVAEVEGEGHEEAHRHDAQHVEPHRHLALDLHHF